VLDDLLANPVAFVQRIIANARILSGQIFGHTIFPTFLGIPLLLGLVNAAWDRQRLRRETFLTAVAAAPLVAFLPFHIEIRFFAPAFPILAMWAAHGLVCIGHWLADTCETLRHREVGRRLREALAILPVVLVAVYFVMVIPTVVSADQRALDWTHKDAGLWLKQNTAPGSVIMTRDLAIAVYAERPWIPSPNAEYERVMAYGRYHGAVYFVVDEAEITNLRPQLQSLLDEQNPPSGLVHVETFKNGNRRTIVYRIP
jgi:hypothetical protein